MKLVVRKAELADFQSLLKLVMQVQEIHVNARPDLYIQTDNPIEIQAFQDLLKKENHFIYLLVDASVGEIIAYTIIRIEMLIGSPIMKERKTLFVNDFAVDKSYRGQGIGKYLFDFVINMGKELKVNSIDLSVAEFNEQAMEFYKYLGMKTRSRRMEYIFE